MNKSISAKECITKCKLVFGFGEQYVTKLINEKSDSDSFESKEKSASEILEFARNIESIYGTDFSKVMNIILIEKKTIKQNLFRNINNLEVVHGIFQEAYPFVEKIKLSKAENDPMRDYLNLGVVGKKA